MSYTIVKSITISKDRQTFSMNWASNNVYPKDWRTSKDMPIVWLLYSFSTGDFQYRWSNNPKLLRIARLARKYRDLYNDWVEEKETLFYQNNPYDKKITEKYREIHEQFMTELYAPKKEVHILSMWYHIQKIWQRRLRSNSKPKVRDEEVWLDLQLKYKWIELEYII